MHKHGRARRRAAAAVREQRAPLREPVEPLRRDLGRARARDCERGRQHVRDVEEVLVRRTTTRPARRDTKTNQMVAGICYGTTSLLC